MKNLQPLQNAGNPREFCMREGIDLVIRSHQFVRQGYKARNWQKRHGFWYINSTLKKMKPMFNWHPFEKQRCLDVYKHIYPTFFWFYASIWAIYIYMYLSMLYRCFLVAKIAWRLAAWVGDAWWPFDHPFFCSCLDQSDSFKRENMEDWQPTPAVAPRWLLIFSQKNWSLQELVGPCW